MTASLINRFLLIGTSILILGCAGEEISDKPEGVIHTEKDKLVFPDDLFLLHGVFKDDQGISNIELHSDALDIDFNIDLSSTVPKSYQLRYQNSFEESLPADTYPIDIVVTNVLDESTKFEYVLHFAKLPIIKGLELIYEGSPGDQISLIGELQDEQGLFRFHMFCPDLDVFITTDFTDFVPNYVLSEAFTIPDYAIEGKYPLTFVVTNRRMLGKEIDGGYLDVKVSD